jgi:signal transduction histidine kinase
MLLGISQAVVINVLAILILSENASLQFIVPLTTLILIVLIGYAIIRHKLFDIRAVVARSVAFILSIALVGLIYGFVSFRLVAPFVQNISQSSRYAIFTILAVIIAFTFAPLRRLFEKLTDKLFYRDKYDPQELISEIGHILSSEIRLDTLDRKVTAELTSKMKVSRAYIVVLDKGKIYYPRPGLEDEKARSLGGRFDIKDLMHLGKSMIVADDLSTESERKKIFDKYNIGISTVLKTKEDLVGFLLVGSKKSGDVFNTQDLRVIRIISNELAVAIQNAKAYEQIRRFNETLKTKINIATKQLQTANYKLKELDKAKDEFISMASHQLRTPLTTVKGYLSMLDEGDFGKLTKEQKGSIKLAFDGADRMAGLIGDLLNISRMEAGRFFIDAHPVDLNAIVKNEVDQLQFRANSMGVKLSLKVGKIVPQINLDEDKTRQVIMNLVDNAIHYSPKGEVRVEFGLDGDQAVLKVIDDGIGVSEKDQKSLFTKFFRASNAQKTRPDGTGLGLFLVKRVVEDQGGEVIFESEVGKGSTFGFRFPVKK